MPGQTEKGQHHVLVIALRKTYSASPPRNSMHQIQIRRATDWAAIDIVSDEYHRIAAAPAQSQSSSRPVHRHIREYRRWRIVGLWDDFSYVP